MVTLWQSHFLPAMNVRHFVDPGSGYYLFLSSSVRDENILPSVRGSEMGKDDNKYISSQCETVISCMAAGIYLQQTFLPPTNVLVTDIYLLYSEFYR